MTCIYHGLVDDTNVSDWQRLCRVCCERGWPPQTTFFRGALTALTFGSADANLFAWNWQAKSHTCMCEATLHFPLSKIYSFLDGYCTNYLRIDILMVWIGNEISNQCKLKATWAHSIIGFDPSDFAQDEQRVVCFILERGWRCTPFCRQ